jgi:hypothetical protein
MIAFAEVVQISVSFICSITIRKPGTPVSAKTQGHPLIGNVQDDESRWHHERPLVLLARGRILSLFAAHFGGAAC